MAAAVPLEAPWTAAQALAWDSQTVETWVQTRVSDERVRTWLREIVRGTLAAEARDVSLLHALFFLRSAGGMAALLGAISSPEQAASASAARTRSASRLIPSGT